MYCALIYQKHSISEPKSLKNTHVNRTMYVQLQLYAQIQQMYIKRREESDLYCRSTQMIVHRKYIESTYISIVDRKCIERSNKYESLRMFPNKCIEAKLAPRLEMIDFRFVYVSFFYSLHYRHRANKYSLFTTNCDQRRMCLCLFFV